MKPILRTSLWAWMLLVGATTSAWADGVVRNSVGATSSGRGGTNIAHSDNGSILLNNPAGMMNIQGKQFSEFGIGALITDLEYSDPQNSTSAMFRPMALPEFSLFRKSDDGTWAAGFGVFVPAGFGAQWDMTNPVVGRHGYKSLGAIAKLLASGAVQVTDRLSLGAGIGPAISHAELEGPFFLQSGALAGVPTVMDIQGTGVALTWNAGLQYQLSERTTLGATYISETRFRLGGNARVDAYGLGAEPVNSRFDLETDLVWPRSAGVGIKHLLRDRHRVSADAVWYDWSHAFNRLDMRLTNPSSPVFAAFGPEIRDSLALNWKDSVSVRLGYEFFATPDDTIRAGYVYDSKTVPTSTLTTYIPATLEHTFSAGYGKRWGSCRCDVAYQFAFGPEQKVGTSDIVGGDFSFSNFTARSHWLFISFSKEF